LPRSPHETGLTATPACWRPPGPLRQPAIATQERVYRATRDPSSANSTAQNTRICTSATPQNRPRHTHTESAFGAICGANDREHELTLSGGVLSWPDGWADPVYERQEQALNGRFSTLPAGPPHRPSRALPKAFFLFSGPAPSPRPGLYPPAGRCHSRGTEPQLERVFGTSRGPGCGTLLLYSRTLCSNFASDL
jgi:hypothetical protein